MKQDFRTRARDGVSGGQGEMSIRLSVVMACLNEEEVIESQLEALSAQRWSESWELVIVDNGSTDGTRGVIERYRQHLPQMQLIDASERQSRPYAMNRGVDAAHGSALAFCDADDVVGKGWVAAMGDALTEHEFVAGPFKAGRLNEPWVLETRVNPQAHGLQRDYYLPHAGAGNMGIRRSLFRAIGGFDEALPHLFDTDFCWRVQEQADVSLTFVPDAILHVRYRDSFWSIFRQARDYSRYMPLLLENHGVEEKRKPRDWKALLSLLRMILGQLRRVRSRGDLGKWCWDLGGRIGDIEYRRYGLSSPQERPCEGSLNDRKADHAISG